MDAENILQLFSWLFQEPRNYVLGALYFILGIVGALVTTYLAVGSVMPGTAGSTELNRRAQDIEASNKRAEELSVKAQELIDDPSASELRINWYTARAQEAQERADKERTTLDREKNRQFLQAFPFYVVVGAILAMALAQDLIQAAIIGAGWPAVWGSYFNKQQVQEANEDNAALKVEVQTKEADKAILQEQVVSAQPAVAEMQRLLPRLVQGAQHPELKQTLSEVADLTEQVADTVKRVRRA